MPLFSAFTPFGALAFASRPSEVETIYRSLLNSVSGAGGYRVQPGDEAEAKIYAQARAKARARLTLRRAANQAGGLTAIEMLPTLENDWGVVTSETDTVLARQRNVDAAMKAPLGAAFGRLSDALTSLLGSSFIALRATAASEAVPYFGPSAFSPLGFPFKLIRLLDPIAGGGALLAARYVNLDPSAPPVVINVGETVLVEPETPGITERVLVQLTSPGRFVGNFQNPHSPLATGTTANLCTWSSSQRLLYVIVTASVVSDPETRRRIHALMARTVPGVTEWAIVAPTSPGARTIGPYRPGVHVPGTTTIGQIAF